jgi:hypothetical protein
LAFLQRHGNRWFLPVLLAQSLLLAAAGERSPLIINAIALLLLLGHGGQRSRRTHLLAALALTLLAVLAITGLRAEQGRSIFGSNSGLGPRAKALSMGLTATSVPGTPGPHSAGCCPAGRDRVRGGHPAGRAFRAAAAEPGGGPGVAAARSAQRRVAFQVG